MSAVENTEPQTESSPPSIPDAAARANSNEVGVKDAVILKEEAASRNDVLLCAIQLHDLA
jgi:hypothetical protein